MQESRKGKFGENQGMKLYSKAENNSHELPFAASCCAFSASNFSFPPQLQTNEQHQHLE
jgi:hypothetical protein